MQVECLRVWKLHTAKLGGLCANACAGAELSACRKRGGFRTPLDSLLIFCAYGSFSFGAPRGLFLPQELILFPRSLYGSSVHCCSTGFFAKTHWGLNKTVGISALPTMHHAEGKASIRSSQRQRTVNGEIPFAKRIVPSLARASAQSERALVAVIPTLDSPSTCGLFASFLQPFFFQTKKKVDRSPFPKGKEPSPVGRQKPSFHFFTEKNSPYAEIRTRGNCYFFLGYAFWSQ